MTKTAVDTKKRRKKKGIEQTPVHHIGNVSKKLLQDLAAKHGTPIFVIDHEKLRENYREFKRHMPDVQVYFAVKANSNAQIVKTLYDIGCSFDVASMPEFMIVYENIKHMPKKERPSRSIRWRRWTSINPSSHSTTTMRSLRSETMPPMRGSCFGSAYPTLVLWLSYRPNSAPTRVKRWIS